MSIALTSGLLTALFFVAALLMLAQVTFPRRLPSFPIELAYTDEEKESYRKTIEATFGKAVPFPGLFHEITSMDFLVIPPNESCPFFILCTMGFA